MKETRQATHTHKRQGGVVVLESTMELAKVVVAGSGDEFWVKLIDLTPVGAVVVTESKPKKVKAEKIKLARSAHAA